MLSLILAASCCAGRLPPPISYVPPVYWVAFCAGTVVLLVLDMFVFHRHAHEPTLRESAMWTVFWCSLALAFNGWIWWWFGHDARASQFFTGYSSNGRCRWTTCSCSW